jgi:hypothetical protein
VLGLPPDGRDRLTVPGSIGEAPHDDVAYCGIVEALEVPHGLALALAAIVCGAIVVGAIAHFLEPIITLLRGLKEWWEDRG